MSKIDPILPSSITTVGLAAQDKEVSFVDNSTIAYSSGNGLVLQNLENGAQRHLWGLSSKGFGGSSGPALHAACPDKQLLAWVQNSMGGSELQILHSSDLRVLATVKPVITKGDWRQLMFSQDGSWLLTISESLTEAGPSENTQGGDRLDVWRVKEALHSSDGGSSAPSTRSPSPSHRASDQGTHRGLDTTLCMQHEAHIMLGGSRLSRVGVGFNPINPLSFCTLGSKGVMLVYMEPVLESCIVRQSSVNLSILREAETLTSFAWTPNGSLLLGTSDGRMLLVQNAAPSAIPCEPWGPPAGHDAEGHTAVLLFGPAPGSAQAKGNVGAAVFLAVTHRYILMVLGGGAEGPSRLLYLDPCSPGTRPITTCPLPGLQQLHVARLSPDLQSLLLYSKDGLLAHATLSWGRPQGQRTSKPAVAVVERPTTPEVKDKLNDDNDHEWTPGMLEKMREMERPPVPVPSSSSPEPPPVDEGAAPSVLACRLLGCFHSGPVTAVATLPNQKVVSGSTDGSVRLWQLKSGGSHGVAATARLLGIWSIGSHITCVTPYVPGKLNKVFLVGTAGGHLMLLNSDHPELMLEAQATADSYSGAAAQELAQLVSSSRRVSSWELHAIKGPVTATAFSSDGLYCAAAGTKSNQIAFLKVMRGIREVSLQLLGFYNFRDPHAIAFAPMLAPGAERSALPMLAVATASGEVQVLSVPDSSFVNRNAEAMIGDGTLCLAYMRCQSGITSICSTLALPESSPGLSERSSGSGQTTNISKGSPASMDENTFWVWAACTDKSLKRFRMLSDAQQSAAESHRTNLKLAAAAAAKAKPGGPPPPAPRATNISFAMPDTERAMCLGMPAMHLSIASVHALAPTPEREGGPDGADLAISLTQQPPASLTMMAATQDGAVTAYALPDMSVMARWSLHDLASGGCTAAAMCPGMLVSAGGDGTLHFLELLPPVSADSSSKSAAMARARAMAAQAECLTTSKAGSLHCFQSATCGIQPTQASSALPKSAAAETGKPSLDLAIWQDVAVLHASVSGILDWKESRFQMSVMGKALETKAFKEIISERKAVISAKLEKLAERERKAAEEGDKEGEEKYVEVPREEWIIDVKLRDELRAEADVHIAARKACLQKEMAIPQVLLERERALCWDSAEVQQRKVTHLPEHTFVSVLTPDEQKRWKDNGAVVKTDEVCSYPLLKLSKKEEAQLTKIKFLRQVEQLEWQERPVAQRGVVTSLHRYTGRMASKVNFSEDGGETPEAPPAVVPTLAVPLSASSTAATPRDVPQSDPAEKGPEEAEASVPVSSGPTIEGTSVENGLTKLLYSNLQLHTLHRKVSQVALLKEEVRALQRVFNSKVKETWEVKQTDISRIEERLNRIRDIQNLLAEMTATANGEELPDPISAPSGYGVHPAEDMAALLEVNDDEVKVEKYVSPEERARLAEEARIAEEARRRAEADDAKQRALKEMMNGKVAIRKQNDSAAVLKREAWMDVPRTQMSKEQRIKLIEFEKKVADAAEGEEKQKRLLETERKALEIEVYDIIVDFNNALYNVHNHKVVMDVELSSLELQQLVCASAAEVYHHAEARGSHAAVLLNKMTIRREKRTALAAEMKKLLHIVQRQYDTLHSQEKQMDKVFRREFGAREDIFEEVSKVYRDRRHALSGAPIRSALELLAKTAEGAPPHRSPAPSPSPGGERSMASRMMAEEMSLGVPDGSTIQPSLLPALQHWLEEGLAREGAVGDTVPPTPRPDGSFMTHGGPIATLKAMATGGRPLEPVIEALLEGRPLHSLGAANPGLLGLGMPDVSSGLDPFVSPTIRAMFEPGSAKIQARAKLEEGDAPLSLAPWDSTNQKPDGLDDAWWLRLMEYRDSRIVLEKNALKVWDELCLLAVSLEGVEREVLLLNEQVIAAITRQKQLKTTVQTALLDLGLVYRLTNGQVEVPSTTGASFLKLSRVERFNDAIVERGTDQVEMLRGLKGLKKDIHLAEWENAAIELLKQHKVAELKELQLLHVTKELQAAMRDPENVDKMDQEAAMVKLLEGSQGSHLQRRELKIRTLARLTERVASNIEVHQALTLTEKSAALSYADSGAVHKIMTHNRASDDAAHKRHLRNVVTNKQLSDISISQAIELAQLAREMAQLEERAFPSLTPRHPIVYGPDVTMPRTYGPPRSALGSRGSDRTTMASRNGPRSNMSSRPGTAFAPSGMPPRNARSALGPGGAEQAGSARSTSAQRSSRPGTSSNGGMLRRKLESR